MRSNKQPRRTFASLALVALVSLALTLALTLAGCGQPSASDTVLTYSWPNNAGPLNPHLYSPNEMYAQNMVYEPLVWYGPEGKILPWLAVSWTVSDDGRVYTFQLRPGVKFSNGEAFNAAAVKANFDAVLANRSKHTWLGLVTRLQAVRAVADDVVELELSSAYYPALQELTLIRPVRFVAPSQIPPGGSTAEGILAPIGTGPWVLESSTLGVEDVFVRNEGYWGKKPGFGRVVVKVIADPNARITAFETGDIDLIYGFGQASADTLARLQKDTRYTSAVSEPMVTSTLALNSARGPLADLAVRQAIQHALDRPSISQALFAGVEAPATALYASNVPYADLDLPPLGYDTARADALLSGAGWVQAAPGVVREKAGAPLKLNLIFNGSDANQKAMAEVLQAQLGKVGIDLVLEGLERTIYYQRYNSGDYEAIFRETWGPPYEPHAFLNSDGHNLHQSGLPMKEELNKLLATAMGSTDEDQRRALYRQILTVLHEQSIYVPLVYTRAFAVSRSKVQVPSFGTTANDIPFVDMVPGK